MYIVRHCQSQPVSLDHLHLPGGSVADELSTELACASLCRQLDSRHASFPPPSSGFKQDLRPAQVSLDNSFTISSLDIDWFIVQLHSTRVKLCEILGLLSQLLLLTQDFVLVSAPSHKALLIPPGNLPLSVFISASPARLEVVGSLRVVASFSSYMRNLGLEPASLLSW
jgi:hypothetical protein